MPLYRRRLTRWSVVVWSVLAACSGPRGPEAEGPGLSTRPDSLTTAPALPASSPPASSGGPAQPGALSCQEKPPASGLALEWLPSDLPLPDQTYAVEQLQRPPGIEFVSGLLATPLSLDDFASFAQREWPKRGYLLTRRESEPGEVEAIFVKGDRYGSYRVRSYCDNPWSQLYIGYGLTSAPTLGGEATATATGDGRPRGP